MEQLAEVNVVPNPASGNIELNAPVIIDQTLTLKGGFVQASKQIVASVSLAASAGGSDDIALMTMTFKDGNGTAITYPMLFTWWLSDGATGIGLTGTTSSGAAGAGATGTDLNVVVAKKMTQSQCSVGGVYIASIADTAETAFVVTVQLDNGTMWTGPALVYG